MKMRLATPAHLIDMKNLRSLMQYIHDEGTHLTIGALSTYYQIMSSKLVLQKAPLLAQTLAEVGDMQVRNLGTLGGSIAHADPAGDPPAAILASDASMVIKGPSGERTVAATDFFQGFFETAVGEGEILTEIKVPIQKGGSSYQKFKHPASGYAVVGVAAVVEKSGQTISACRVAVTGVSEGAYRANDVESALIGQAFSEDAVSKAASHAANGVDSLEDPFADAPYRVQLAKTMAKRAILAAWKNA
jgi:carbon-monoxide dehydrogenase medium subunit